MQKTILLLSCLLIASCDKSLFNTGKTIEQKIELEDDLWVAELQNIFEITLVKDSVNYALVTCGENLMDDIKIYSDNHILYLNHSVSNNWSRKYEKIKVNLHLKTIPRLNIREPSLITTNGTFKTDFFDFVVWCQFAEINATIDARSCEIYMSLSDFGKYTIKGNCTDADINPAGSGVVNCRELITENCKIWQRSIAHAFINVTKKLTVKFKDSGNIYYTGNPDSIILLNQPKTGKLIELEL